MFAKMFGGLVVVFGLTTLVAAWSGSDASSASGCCQRGVKCCNPATASFTATEPVKNADQEEGIKAARAKLSKEDQALVAAQEFCPMMPDSRLGVMGTPVKVMVKDQPVFVCCKGCTRKALADPEKTLAKVKELQAKVKEKSSSK